MVPGMQLEALKVLLVCEIEISAGYRYHHNSQEEAAVDVEALGAFCCC
jgi:hypothetical protein